MILEGVVTTLNEAGEVNVAPMGPRLFPPYRLEVGSSFELRPFRTSHTCANLTAHPEAVLHVTDDVLLIAQAAIGELGPVTMMPAVSLRGMVLTGACRAYEVRVGAPEGGPERPAFRAQVHHVHHLRDFFGLNRAMFAVVEAAILATRVHLLPRAVIEADCDRLTVLVEKTGGHREAEAFALLRGYIAEQWASGQK